MSIDNDHFIYSGVFGIQLDTIHRKITVYMYVKIDV